MKKRLLILFILIFGLPLAAAALAQNIQEQQPGEPMLQKPPASGLQLAKEKELTVDILPQSEAADLGLIVDLSRATHPAIKLTPDKSEMIKIDRTAGTVIVGNPAHINVLADTGNTLIVIARAPGASYFSVLDQDGQIIMQRHVLVAAPKKDYLRVRKACNADSGESCQRLSVYYCPDICHEIALPASSDDSAAGASEEAAGAQDVADAVPAPPTGEEAPQ